MASLDGLTVAVLGGTGPQGRGLVRRWAAAGHPGRDRQPRRPTAPPRPRPSLAEATGGDVRGLTNEDAAAAGDVVVVAVPVRRPCRPAALAGGRPGRQGRRRLREPARLRQAGRLRARRSRTGSAAQQAAALLPESTVVAAFHHVSAALLDDPRDRLRRHRRAGAGRRPRRDRPGARRSPTRSRGCAGCTAVGCATPARSRR